MTRGWQRTVGAALALAGLVALARRRRGLLGRAEALLLLLLLALILTAGLGDPAALTSPLVAAALLAGAVALTLADRAADRRGDRDQRTVEALVDHAWIDCPEAMTRDASLVLVMPAFDEADNLRALLPDRPADLLGHVPHLIVVDDGSRDDTAAVAAAHGAWAIRVPHNRGGGFALKVGFAAARRLRARFILTLDADGQHRWVDLPRVLAPLVAGEADLVVGSRRLGASIDGAWLRGLGVRVFSAVLTFLLGRRITDCASGLRGLATARLAALHLRQVRHHTAELLIEAARRGLTITEVPITIVPRHTGASKKGGAVGYALRFAATILVTWWRR